MNTELITLDTNVPVYAVDDAAKDKQDFQSGATRRGI